MRAQGFTRVVSLLASSHNLHAYEELGLDCAHVSMGVRADIPTVLGELYPQLLGWLRAGERILVHQDELGDRVAGVFAGFLWWSGMIPEPPLAISAIEHLLRRQLGSTGRTIAMLATEVPLPAEDDRRHPAPRSGETVVNLRVESQGTGEPGAPAGLRTGPEAIPEARSTGAMGVALTPVVPIAVRPSRARSGRVTPKVAELQPLHLPQPAREKTARVPVDQPAPKPAKTPTRRTGSPPAKAAARQATARRPTSGGKPASKPAKTPGGKVEVGPATAPARQKAPSAKVTSGASAKPTSRRHVGAR